MLAQQMENLLVQKTDPTKVIIEKLQVQTTKKEISKITLSRWFEILTLFQITYFTDCHPATKSMIFPSFCIDGHT